MDLLRHNAEPRHSRRRLGVRPGGKQLEDFRASHGVISQIQILEVIRNANTQPRDCHNINCPERVAGFRNPANW
jgi:hypothetical protein